MRTTDTDENWRLLKQFAFPGDRINTDSLMGYEAAIARTRSESNCPDHIFSDNQRYADYCDGFRAGRRRLDNLMTSASGTKANGERWIVQRKGHKVSVARLLGQAERNGVVGNVDITYSDMATGERRSKTWGI